VRVVVVTGSNRGTGRAVARAFHEVGDRVVGLNRTPSGAGWMHEVGCDLRRPERIDAAVREVVERFGRIDILVNSAAVRRFAPVHLMKDEDWRESVAVNLDAVFRLTRAAAPHLIESKGLVVFMGSHAGIYFFEKGAAYCATKAAVHALAEVVIRDLRHEGVRATLIAPGAIANREGDPAAWKIRPEDVGRLVVALASTPPSLIPGFVEVRPSKPPRLPFDGIELLQYF